MLDLKLRTLLSHVQEVRSLLNDTGCMSSNPFFVENDERALSRRFTLFATDVENAASKLEVITGVQNDIKDVDPVHVDRVADEFTVGSSLQQRELYLSKMFEIARMKPYFDLCKIEDLAKSRKEIHPLTAQEAMGGLKNLYVVVKAISAVYAKTLEMNS